jgi:hypothetical protein
MSTSDSLIDFPCDFPIKVFGNAHPDLIPTVVSLIVLHDPLFSLSDVSTKESKTARYLSLTCTVRATSKAQLDAIYQALCDHPLVKMAL